MFTAKYEYGTSHWLPKREVSRGVSKIWKNIISVGLRNETIFSIFLNGSKISVGRGIDIFFLKEPWAGDFTLSQQFPRLINLAINKDISLKEALTTRLEDVIWRGLFRRQLFSWEEGEVSTLINLVKNAPTLNQNKEDDMEV